MALLDGLFISSNEGSLGCRNDESSSHAQDGSYDIHDNGIGQSSYERLSGQFCRRINETNDSRIALEALKKGLDVQVVYDQRFITLKARHYFFWTK